MWGWPDEDVASFIHVSRSHEDTGPESLEAMLETKGVAADEPQAHSGRYLQVLTGTELNKYTKVEPHFLAEVHQLSQSVKKDVFTLELESKRALSCVAP